ncbi:hypothetical protein Pla108_26000 [Botrimarina colliarenosi]|uniref:Uncharacterized protein n=1 Tax=Botrimarina colliarenosi TaxID=2528001 RepID=A0A5C6ABK7_9BACT|nr:hypothetical protein [Botrimarina colliarenosi]TWT96826.1 hypothetical protein Pla108_26000 [Botrimarina colliarenosi]
MLSESHRRLWRRRLRRRPLLPFLLAAFVAVDVVALNLGGASVSDWVELAVLALFGAQLSLLAIWTTHSLRGWAPRLTITSALLLTAIGLVEQPGEEDYLRPVVFPIFALTCLGVMVARWLASAAGPTTISPRRSRFGIATILWATLVVAILIAALRDVEWGYLLSPLILLLSVAEAALAVAISYLNRLCPRGRKRWIALIGAPSVCVLGATYLAMKPRGGPPIAPRPEDFLPYYAMQALITGASLMALTPKLFKRSSESVDDEKAEPESLEPTKLDVSI